jgi:hypothetical protein
MVLFHWFWNECMLTRSKQYYLPPRVNLFSLGITSRTVFQISFEKFHLVRHFAKPADTLGFVKTINCFSPTGLIPPKFESRRLIVNHLKKEAAFLKILWVTFFVTLEPHKITTFHTLIARWYQSILVPMYPINIQSTVAPRGKSHSGGTRENRPLILQSICLRS